MTTSRVSLHGGGTLAVEMDGDDAPGRVPLLLVRPLGGSMALWGQFRQSLAEHRRVIAFDLRGTGGSSALPWGHGLRGLADDVSALLDVLGVPRVDVFGLSLGGVIAARFAVKHAARVRRLVLASTPVRGIDLGPRGVRKALDLARCLALPARQAEACLARRVLSHEYRRTHSDALEAIGEHAATRPASRVTLVRLVLVSALYDAPRLLRRIEAPTLVLAGGADSLVGPAAAEQIARLVPNARMTTLGGAGHDLSLESPLATAKVVELFLDEGLSDRC